MVAGIRPMQIEGRKLPDEVIWRSPDLNVRIVGDCNKPEGKGVRLRPRTAIKHGLYILAIRRKLDSIYWLFEVVVVQHHPSSYVHEQRSAICVHLLHGKSAQERTTHLRLH